MYDSEINNNIMKLGIMLAWQLTQQLSRWIIQANNYIVVTEDKQLDTINELSASTTVLIHWNMILVYTIQNKHPKISKLLKMPH